MAEKKVLRERPNRTTTPVEDPAALDHERLVEEYGRLAAGARGLSRALRRSRRQAHEYHPRALAAEKSMVTEHQTGLGNKFGFERDLEHLVAIAEREGSEVVVLTLDVNQFKDINDRVGHLAGDDTAVAVAGCVQQALQRETDRAYRPGGDEFSVIMPNTGVDGAQVVGERIIQQLMDTAIPHPTNETVAVSIGIAVFQGRGRARRSEDDWSASDVARQLADQADVAAIESKRRYRWEKLWNRFNTLGGILGSHATGSQITAVNWDGVIEKGESLAFKEK
jgi:diguanylate cyclase (GGDEF)-like protein